MADVSDALKPVVPIAVFIVVLVILISFSATLFETPEDSSNYQIISKDGILTREYTFTYAVGQAPSYTQWDAHNSSCILDDYDNATTSNVQEYYVASWDVYVDTVVIRNNTDWDSSSYPNNESFRSPDFTENDRDLYKDSVAFSYGHFAWFRIHHVTFWVCFISYHDILENFNGNTSAISTGWDGGGVGNLSLLISVDDALEPEQYETAIYTNHFNISVMFPDQERYDAWSTLWNVLTFDTEWIADTGIIGFFISFFIDVMVAIVVVTVILAVIPFT